MPPSSFANLRAYGYPPPYPYNPPPFVYPPLAEPARDTLKGLSRLRQATWVALAASGVTTAIGVIALYLVVQPGAGSSVWSFPPALGLLLVVLMTQLIAVALGWDAFEEITEAAVEINQEHQVSAKRGIQLMYFATAAWFIGGLAGVTVYGSTLFNSLSSFQLDRATSLASLSLIGSLALTGIAVNVLLAAGMQSLLAKIMREQGRARRSLFYALALGGTLASVAVSLYCVAVLNGPDLHPLLGVVSAASLAVYLSQIREAEEGARVLAVTRGADPDAPMPQPPGAPSVPV